MSGLFQQEEELFAQAIALPPAERPNFLRRICTDETLYARVAALLHEHDHHAGFLESPPAEALGEAIRFVRETSGPLEESGAHVGRYQLLERIGEGGCGVVYRAAQTEPVRREVALKIIKLGMDTNAVIARFEAERQALALMDHPNIARAFDAGASAQGRPFFVMELVHGTRITEYCDAHRLSPDQRLRLFRQVCSAVQHAHQKGLIHRDLKPSNILVADLAGTPVPKVIDFGIAKATQGPLTDRTLFTVFEQFIGTPAYMSPEQAGGTTSDIDTRSDIYSLGVLLHELLAGCTPVEFPPLAQAGVVEIRRRICEAEFPRPSARLLSLTPAALAATAETRRVTPPVLVQLLRSDLDWVVLRCLEKDRARRYPTVNGLARDIERHLAGETVSARPPTAAYVLRKFIRRHRTGVLAGGAVVLALLAGLTASTMLYLREKAALLRALEAEQASASLRRLAEAGETKARTEAARSAQIARFMQQMLGGVAPARAQGRDTSLLREILDETVQRLDSGLKAEPEVEADLRETLGNVYLGLGEATRAAAMYRATLALRRQLAGKDDLTVAAALNNLGDALHLEANGHEDACYQEALGIQRKILGNQHLKVAETLTKLGLAFVPVRMDEAKAALTEALAIEEGRPDTPATQTVVTLVSLGEMFRRSNDWVRAEATFRRILAIIQRNPEAGDLQLARDRTLWGLGTVQWMRGHLPEAESTFRELLALDKTILNEGNPRTGQTLNQLGNVLYQQHRFPEAEAVQREQVELSRRLVAREPANHSYETDLSQALNHLGDVLAREGKDAAAEPVLQEAVAMRRTRTSPKGRGELAGSLFLLGDSLLHQGKLAGAEAAFREALGLEKELLDWRGYYIASGLIRTLRLEGKEREVDETWAELLALSRNEPVEAGRTSSGIFTLATISVMLAEGQAALAESTARENLARAENLPPRDWRRFATHSLLGGALARQQKFAEAEPWLLSGCAGLQECRETIPPGGGRLLVFAFDGLEQLYAAWNKPEQAAEWKRQHQEKNPEAKP